MRKKRKKDCPIPGISRQWNDASKQETQTTFIWVRSDWPPLKLESHMPYTKKQMYDEVALIYRNPENWMWEKNKDQASLSNKWKKNTASKKWELTSHVQAGGQVNLKTLQEYCWVAYDKAFRAV